ncbi:MAG TPA: phosphoglycerate kinase [Clostridiales bacterium]|nr:phosphoglycerate kinase [Clostridiales bacterium]
MNIKSISQVDVKNKLVLFRPDINSPINKEGKIINFNRINQTLETLNYLLNNRARVAIIAHQGDVLDYQNLIPLEEHAKILSELTGKNIAYIDDVCGDAAIEKIKKIKNGEAIILGNLRYLAEEMSSFENYVQLNPEDMKKVYLIRRLAPLFDLYVNDAFAAAHRNSPSMTGFQQILPSAAGFLFFKEYTMLSKVLSNPEKPVTFIFGGAKVSDSFSIMEKILTDNIADNILTCGLLAQLMHFAFGTNLGEKNKNFLEKKNILIYLDKAKELLQKYGDRIILPLDFAYNNNEKRTEILVSDFPKEVEILDIGEKTIELYRQYILNSKTIFYNGPSGVYEDSRFENGTKGIFDAIADSNGFSVIGGGDTVTALKKLSNESSVSYVSTAGGAMIQFLSGKTLPLIKAMINSK